MHEMSIAMSLLELAEEEMRKKNCARILTVHVICGALSGVLPDALKLCFDALTAATIHKNAKLEIEIIPAKFKCNFCGTIFLGENEYLAPCPQCGEDFGHTLLQGKELLLASIAAG